MEIIILNSDNCKEYTTEEIMAKCGLTEADMVDDSNDFDFDVLFSDNEEKIIEEKKETSITDFQKLTLKLLNEAKEELVKWESKKYKFSNKSVFVGGELEGDVYSFNYINNKRRKNAILNAKSDIALYTKDLINSGYKF